MHENLINTFLSIVEQWHFWGYGLILLVSFFESLAFIGIIIPGTVFVVFLGLLSSQGFLNIELLVGCAISGAILGDGTSYYLGKHAEKFFKKNSRLFELKYFKNGKMFFNKYGGRSIFLGRFIGPIRPIVPFVAGVFKMDRKRFLWWNITSAFLWAISFLLVGFFFGQVLDKIMIWTKRSLLIIGLFFILFLLMAWIKNKIFLKINK